MEHFWFLRQKEQVILEKEMVRLFLCWNYAGKEYITQQAAAVCF
jgi:hypothetical protein